MNDNLKNILSLLNDSIEELSLADSKYLYTIFKCRDDLNKCLSTAKAVKEKSNGEETKKIDELLQWLENTKAELLTVFLEKYCLSSVTDEELKKSFLTEIWEESKEILSNIDLNDLPLVSSFVDRNIWWDIFEKIKKEKSKDLFDKDTSIFEIWWDDWEHMISIFIDELYSDKLDKLLQSESFLENLMYDVCEKKWIQETPEIYDLFHGWLDGVKREFLKFERNHVLSIFRDMKLGDPEGYFSLRNAGKSYSLLFLFALNENHIYEILVDYISRSIDHLLGKQWTDEYEWKMSSALSFSIDQVINTSGWDIDTKRVCDSIKECMIATIDPEILLSSEDLDITFDDITRSVEIFWHSVMDVIWKVFDKEDYRLLTKNGGIIDEEDLDRDLMISVIDRHKADVLRVSENKIYSEILRIISKWHQEIFDFSDERRDEIIQSLFDKYPNASNGLRFKHQWKQKTNERKGKFLNDYKWKLKSKISEIFKWLSDMPWIDLNIVSCMYVLAFAELVDVDTLSKQFDEYVKQELEPLFEQSHKRNTKQNEWNRGWWTTDGQWDSVWDMSWMLSNLKTALDMTRGMEWRTWSELLKTTFKWWWDGFKWFASWFATETPIKLPDEIKTELTKYFGKSVDYILIAYLSKLLRKQWWWYKKQWFEKYGIKPDDTGFFDILNKYKFKCIDDIESPKDISEMNRWSTPSDDDKVWTEETPEEKEDNSELMKKFDEAVALRKMDEKIDKLLDILEQLWYNCDNKEKMKSLLVDKCASNKVLSGWFEGVVRNLINWTLIEEKKRWDNAFYSIAIWVTWYRLLIKIRWGQKYIFNCMSHNDYDKYLRDNAN